MSDEQQSDDVASLTEALDLVEFDLDEVEEALDGAHQAVWGDEDLQQRRLKFTFRTATYSKRWPEVSKYKRKTGDWMQYRCDLTGMDVAVPHRAAIPQVLLCEKSLHDGWTLVETYKVHPDLLKDRGRLFEMLVSKFKDQVHVGFYQARKGLDALRFLTGADELPGVPPEGASYPREEGYEAVGKHRPIEPDGDEDD
jgi:hypothetical protein